MKKLISFALSSLLGLTGVTAINILNPTPVFAQLLNVRGGTVYNFENNQHGLIIRTSLGVFYLGRSGDAIRQVNKQRYYGSWRKQYIAKDGLLIVYVYIQNKTYVFDMDESFGEDF